MIRYVHMWNRWLLTVLVAPLLLGTSHLGSGNSPETAEGIIDLGVVSPDLELGATLLVKGTRSVALAKFLEEIGNPANPDYARYLSPHEFADKFGPTKMVYDQLRAEVLRADLKITKSYSSRTLLSIGGHAGDLGRFLGSTFHQYAIDGRIYVHLAGEPRFAPALQPLVGGAAGLGSWRSGDSENLQLSASASPNLSAALTPAQIKTIYGMQSVPEDGTGETLAILDFDGYKESDIQNYISRFNVTNPAPREVVAIDGFSGQPAGTKGQGETTLDVEMAYAIAPHLKKILIYEAPPNAASGEITKLLAAAANDNRATVVSVSLGKPEPQTDASDLQAQNTVLMQFAAQGTTVLIASGDSGAYAGTTGQVAVANPGAQPYALAVGGTSVVYDSSSNYLSETSWANPSQTRGGGGGISTVWPIPSWQSGLGTTSNLGSPTNRMIPDVSMNADGMVPYYYILNGQQGTQVGGTSFATPLWAAYLSLTNQRRVAAGLPRLGFVNPAIYRIARSSAYATSFHDVNDGSNNLFYPTTAGYDLSTGWGSPKGDVLMGFLANPTLPPSAPTHLAVSVVADDGS